MPAGEVSAAIGKSVQIRGEVKGSEDLLIEGLVEGTITLTDSRLTIGANARVEANVSARDVVILGIMHGDISANGRVELRSGCNVTGDIRSTRLAIEENAVFSGKVDLVQAGASAQERTSAAQPPAAAPSGALFSAQGKS